MKGDRAAEFGQDSLAPPEVVSAFLAEAAKPRLAVRPDAVDTEAADRAVLALGRRSARRLAIQQRSHDGVRPDLCEFDKREATCLACRLPQQRQMRCRFSGCQGVAVVA